MSQPLLRRAALASIPFAAGLCTATPATALTFRGPFDLFPRQFQQHMQSAHRISLHPFRGQTVRLPAAFGLYQNGSMGLEDAVAKAVRGSLHPMVAMRFSNTTDGLSLAAGTSSRDGSFFINGIPLCGFQLRAHTLADRSVLVLGSVPDIDSSMRFAPSEWPDQGLALDRVNAALADEAGEITLSSARRCLFVDNGNLLPVWSLRVRKGGLPFEGFADAYQVQKLEAGFFDAVTGKASVYPRDGTDTATISYDLPELVGDGTLSSAWLQTVFPGKSNKYTRANEPSNTFNYSTSDPKFMETSTFAHAEMHRQFAASIGFEWYGPAPIELKMHIRPGGSLDATTGEWVGGRSNNALFIPGSTDDNSLPQIQIDDGDGTDLQFLSLDGDVVSHEFGHHIVYKTLHSTTGQSLAMHEGLADFFVFARTGDPYLGRSICPLNSGACILPGKALRSAAIDLKYKDANWVSWAGASNRLGHLHGQLISGLLWDLRASGAMSGDDVTHLALKAVSFFQSDSGFRDFIISLFMADKELFNGRDFAALTSHVQDRGLDEFLEGITTVDAELPNLKGGGTSSASGSSVPEATTSSVKKETKSNNNPLKCGVVPGSDPTLPLTLAGILILVAPLLASLLPKPAKAPAKGNSKSGSKQSKNA